MTEQEIRDRLSGDDLSIFEQSVKRLIDNQVAEIRELRAALSTQLPLPSREVVAWMIEFHAFPGSPLWLSCEFEEDKPDFSSDPNKGIRFPTKASAKKFLDLLFSVPRNEQERGRGVMLVGRSCYSITEHAWPLCRSDAPALPADKGAEEPVAYYRDVRRYLEWENSAKEDNEGHMRREWHTYAQRFGDNPKPPDGEGWIPVLAASPQGAALPSTKDYTDTVQAMMDVTGYTEAYAMQWPNEKASVTFLRYLTERGFKANAQSINEPAERAEFEKWADENGYALERKNDTFRGSEYYSGSTNYAWDAWQARAALQGQQSSPAPASRDEPTGQVYGIIDPDYGRVYTMVRKLAWDKGYAIGLHGSFTRDLDMIAVPWAEKPCEPERLIQRILAETGLVNQHSNPRHKPHGRLVWALLFPKAGDPRFIDLSIFSAPAGDIGERSAAIPEAVSNEWDRVWGKWQGHPGLQAIAMQHAEHGNHSAANILNEWIESLLDASPTTTCPESECVYFRCACHPDCGCVTGEIAASPTAPQPPIDMILHCPKCGLQHVDAPEKYHPELDGFPRWTNPPHKSHLCRPEDGGCGHIWRPADVPTNGVKAIKTKGSADHPAPQGQDHVAGGEGTAAKVKKCPNLVNGICPLPNVHCAYPACEKP